VRRRSRCRLDVSLDRRQTIAQRTRCRSVSIGVVIGDLTVPLFPPLLLGVDDVTSAAGYTAVIGNTSNDRERERARISSIRNRGVDRLIVATAA
jgi:LacI family transcriptional regulator